MASAPEAAGTADGPTQHTLTQDPDAPAGPCDLTSYQLKLLFAGVQGSRVRMLRGMAHMEAWDIRRELIRVFGFGGFNIQTVSLDLVAERESKQGDKSRWTVVYRAQVRLTVKDSAGRVMAVYEDGAAGDSQNQPSLGDAHDMAMKTALSQALKRCAVNLGDQFGLSLYNNGSHEAVVNWSAAHPPASVASAPAVPERPEDPPVQPEPQPVVEDSADQAPQSVPAPRSADQPKPSRAQQSQNPSQGASAQQALAELEAKVRNGWNNADATAQNLAEARAKGLTDLAVPGPDGLLYKVVDLLETRLGELRGQQRGAA